jgi:hypothetical protein
VAIGVGILTLVGVGLISCAGGSGTESDSAKVNAVRDRLTTCNLANTLNLDLTAARPDGTDSIGDTVVVVPYTIMDEVIEIRVSVSHDATEGWTVATDDATMLGTGCFGSDKTLARYPNG